MPRRGIMTRFWWIVLLAGGLLAGCQQPADLELTNDGETTSLEILPIAMPDSLIPTASFDSTAILPMDQVKYRGQFLVTRVTLDAGPASSASYALSRVLVADSAVRFQQREIGGNGVDLGPVLLNQEAMVKIQHRITLKRLVLRDTVIVQGVEYLANLSGTYQPGITYTWTAPLSPAGGLSVSIPSPQQLVVASPRGGLVHSREKDLLLRWQGGGGKTQIIVSVYDPLTKRSLPVLELRPKTETGRAILPASVLRQFPQGPWFVFTFVLSNRKVVALAQNTAGGVLIQAADVHNSYIELR
jgi:hypothetical protein